MPIVPHIQLPEGTPLWIRLTFVGLYMAMGVVFALTAYEFHKRSKGK